MSLFKKTSLFFTVAIIVVGGIFSLLNLDISENLEATIPGQSAMEEISPWLEQNKRAVVFSIPVDLNSQEVDEIAELADSLILMIQNQTSNAVQSLKYRSDIDPDDFIDYFFDHLPLYLEPADYKQIDSLIQKETMHQIMQANKSTLLSPEGIGLKRLIIKDPLHLLSLSLKDIKMLRQDDNPMETDGLYFSKQRDQLYIKGILNYNPSDSKQNEIVATQLLRTQTTWNKTRPDNLLTYFGLFLIADANAQQIKEDISVTITLAILFITSLLIYYYRKFVILVLFLAPGIFGVLFALGSIYLIQGHISGLAFGASAIIFGIVADYSFHFFCQFRETNDALKTRNEIFFPLTISSATTIIAFLSLLYADSSTLQDFGLLTSLSLTGTLLFVLGVLPYLLKPFEKNLSFNSSTRLDKLLSKLEIDDSKSNNKLLLLIGLLSGVFLYFSFDVQFEDNLDKLNFYPEDLKKSELALQNINPDKEKRINLLVSHESQEEAFRINSELEVLINELQEEGVIKESNSLGLFLMSKEEQQKKIDKWNQYWGKNQERTLAHLNETSLAAGLNPKAFTAFSSLISKQAQTADLIPFVQQSETLSQLLIQNENRINLIASLVCNKADEKEIKTKLGHIEGVTLVDGKSLIKILIDAVRADFNYLLLFASGAVFIAMLLIYGRLELTLISFIPMVISWIWILGIAGLFDIKFNFINIILATFIFGLGDDFSIFITDGLQKKHKYGEKVLSHYKTGILLSAISTIVGTGVLIFAQHPALKSVAALSVIGIITIVFISFFVQPLLFRFFITSRAEKQKAPMTVWGILRSIAGFATFVVCSVLGVILCLLVRIIPFLSIEKKKHFTRHVLRGVCTFLMVFQPIVRKHIYGKEHIDFDNPSILIANHTSFLDILTLVRMHPNLVLMVNDWVYNSPLFGLVVRYAEYIPAFEGHEQNLSKVQSLVDKGLSIVIFPEGRRSETDKIGRFHKGAFYLAEKLKLDITPLLLHGFDQTIPKHDYYRQSGYGDVTALPRIKWDNAQFGIGYKERTKNISTYFKQEHQKHAFLPRYVHAPFEQLIGIYQFKGPILEWYFKIKWRFEKDNYETYSQLIGSGDKTIYDLGCGYGYLSYFLKLRDKQRTIHALDFDEEKIAVAQHAHLKDDSIHFTTQEICLVKPKKADAIILADVLHYINESEQLAVLENCKKGLKPGGIMLIRDGLADKGEAHEWTKNSEKWSTRLLKFNKIKDQLHFFTKSFIEEWASKNNFGVEVVSHSKKSSNTLFTLTNKNA